MFLNIILCRKNYMNTNMKGKIISLAMMLLVGQMTFAQESKITELTLQQCVQMAVDKNINVKTSRIDKEKSNYKRKNRVRHCSRKSISALVLRTIYRCQQQCFRVNFWANRAPPYLYKWEVSTTQLQQ